MMLVYTANSKNYGTAKQAAKAQPDHDVTETTIPDGVARRELRDGEIVDLTPAELAEQSADTVIDAAKAKAAELEAAYQQTVEAGFTSSALGAPHTYASSQNAQMDLIGIKACNRARRVWCNDGSVWGMVMHTATQIETVINDGADVKEAAFDNLIAKQTAVETVLAGAGTDTEKLAALNAIVW